MSKVADEWDAIEAPAVRGAKLADDWDSLPAVAPVPKAAEKSGRKVDLHSPIGDVIANQATGLGASIIGGWRGLAHLATGGSLKDAAELVHAEQEARTYQPAEGSPGAKAVEAFASPVNPLTWPGIIAKKGGEVAQDMGVSPGVATGVETALTAAPLALMRRGAPARPVETPTIAAQAAPAVAAPMEGLDVPTVIRRAHEARLKAAQEAPQAANEAQAVPQAAPVGRPAPAPAEAVPTGSAPAAPLAPGMTFPESAPVAAEGAKLPAPAQAERAAILKRVGLSEARRSAVEGDAKAAATDFQTSKLDNSAGNYTRGVLDQEKAALQKHAEGIISDTGGTKGLDESARMARGNTVIGPLDSFKQWFDTNISRLYKEADKRSGGVPVEMPDLHKFMGGDRAEFLGTTEGQSLLNGVQARMKSLGMFDAEGKPSGVTVKQAEQLKQYLGNQWQPRTARLIQGMKDAIDEDVMRGAGADIYKEARAIRRMRAVTLDDPKGIAKIMDASGPEGINRAVPVEKIADTITSLPAEQFQHIVQTLKNVPKEIQPQAKAALAEIRAHYANKVHEAGSAQAGQWAAKSVSKYLNNNAEKMRIVFAPEEMAKFGDLNQAGHILAKDQSYPGAAVQEHNLLQRGAMGAIRGGSAAAGAAVGGPMGAAVGDFLGASMAGRFGQRAALEMAKKRVMPLP